MAHPAALSKADETFEPVISARGLTKVYGSRPAVDGLDLEIFRGEVFGFVGPNGAGKTTTLLMLLGLTEPSSGQVRVLGFDPVRQPLQVKRRVGYLPENVGFYHDMTAAQNLDYVAALNGLDRAEAGERITAALATVGLAGEADKRLAAFSRGMRQRLGIAEVLVKGAELVFLDEPTLGLDPDGISRMLDLVRSLAEERRMTVLLSSHLLPQVQRICHRVGVLLDGRLAGLGTVDELAALLGGQGKGSLEEIYMGFFHGEQR